MLTRVAPPATLPDALLRPLVDGCAPAILDRAGQPISFDELRRRVAERLAELDLPRRSLAVLAGGNSVDWVVDYLALLEGGHVPILAAREPDVVAAAWGARALIASDAGEVERFDVAPHELHPDLALLMSTSGSTGRPKLVRLSHRNLVSNATSIADFQRLGAHDCGITSLPLHYCFGLSVLHSHLRVGASVVVTDASVVDPCFGDAMRTGGVTNLAGVPYTYELLDRIDAEALFTRDLRLLTQAGGRLAPDRVRAWAAAAGERGVEFMVMYGQTEATARMAYLPARLAHRHPESIGRAIPGGELSLEPVGTDDLPDGVGELVYEGPNVMLGYAVEPDDLARGATIGRLRTGDLARYHADDDVFEIVGRTSRFVKPFGLRVGLDDVEADLRSWAPERASVAVAGDDDGLVVFVDGGDAGLVVDDVARRVAARTGLPERLVEVRLEPPPRTEAGKIDGSAIRAPRDSAPSDEVPESVAELFGQVLGRHDVGADDTFVTLGGDSLSYVECSIHLERVLGRLPDDWHLRPVGELAAIAPKRSRWARIDTSVLLRAVCICMVVATHMRVQHIPGGAHTLLAVAGYNVARFLTPLESPADRLRAGFRTAGRAAVPTVLWVSAGMLLFGAYSAGTLALVNNYVGPASHDGDHWHFWFIEVFVHLVVLSTLLLAIPAVGRFDRRWQFALPGLLLAIALVLRMEWAQLDDWYNLRFRTHGVAFFFFLGWLIARSSTRRQRAVVSLVAIASVVGFFQMPSREWRILALLLLLVWARTLPFPRSLVRPVGVLAAASMWIYISHFSIWPPLSEVVVREVAYVLTIAAGVAVWFAAERAFGMLNNWRQARRHHPSTTPIALRGTA